MFCSCFLLHQTHISKSFGASGFGRRDIASGFGMRRVTFLQQWAWLWLVLRIPFSECLFWKFVGRRQEKNIPEATDHTKNHASMKTRMKAISSHPFPCLYFPFRLSSSWVNNPPPLQRANTLVERDMPNLANDKCHLALWIPLPCTPRVVNALLSSTTPTTHQPGGPIVAVVGLTFWMETIWISFVNNLESYSNNLITTFCQRGKNVILGKYTYIYLYRSMNSSEFFMGQV